jgi:flavin reductase (DIM6/NTAB) family NADH-FMN oxidoreductase RutF
MGEFATGVTIITTNDDKGEPHAMTANSFTSVCLEPPVVLVCVAHNTHTHGFLAASGRFGVNVLGREQQEIGVYFAKRPEDRTGEVDHRFSDGEDGVPVLENSMVYMGCRVIGTHVYGDHTVYLGEVEEIRKAGNEVPLLFFKSRWYDPSVE